MVHEFYKSLSYVTAGKSSRNRQFAKRDTFTPTATLLERLACTPQGNPPRQTVCRGERVADHEW